MVRHKWRPEEMHRAHIPLHWFVRPSTPSVLLKNSVMTCGILGLGVSKLDLESLILALG